MKALSSRMLGKRLLISMAMMVRWCRDLPQGWNSSGDVFQLEEKVRGIDDV